MAAPNGHYFIQEKLKESAVHHESYKQLWETKWKKPAEVGAYPFMFSTAKDFEPIVQDLVKRNFKPPYDRDEYATAHFPQAKKLLNVAKEADAKGEIEKASEYYLRASAVYRIARFPIPRSDAQREAWRLGKECCLKGLTLRPHPIQEVNFLHTHRLPDEGSTIPVYYLLPDGASEDNPVPCVILITGLDAYRTEAAVFMEGFRQVGIATLAIEVPGTGDCPASRSDPTAPDRLYSSLFDWIAQQNSLDKKNIGAWSYSTGGYYGIRIAHTHSANLAGVVAQGGGCHHMFDLEWLNNINHLEYPIDLAGALADKFGYGDDVEAFKREGSDKFSLLKDGTLDKPDCARLLLVNGTDDEVFPIDDYYLALQHGAPKEARFETGAMHMGGTLSYYASIKWLLDVFEIKADPAAVLQTLSFKPQY